MKKSFILILFMSVTTLPSGCAWEIGGSPQHATIQPTVGQQLVDLHKAKEAGAITDSEYQARRKRNC
jgi:hypothetical protein